MRTIITLSALGLTIALGGAASAKPLDRSEQMQTYRLHKKIYGAVRADRGDRPARGAASTEVRKPG
jgi:hypothetical protein